MGGYIGSKGVGIISGIDASIADLNLTDKAAANGVTEANKVLTADANKDVTDIRKLGIGTTSPSRPLEVFSTQQVMQRLNSGTNTKALLSFEDSNTTGENYVSIGSEGNDMLFRTGGGNRIKFGSAGQLGVGGANYGTSGQVLTSAGSGAAPSWVAASAGGEQTFTATGAISAGDIVGFNPNGTISVSEAVLQTAVAHGGTANGSIVYDTVNDKVLYFYRGSNSYLYGRVGTIANGQISFGTATASASVTINWLDAAFDTNAGKAVAVYTNDGGNNYPYAVVATVSGTNISFGTPVAMKSSGQYRTRVAYDSNAQKVFCIFQGNLYNKVRGRVGTVSGTSISFGTEADVSSQNAAQYFSTLVFDSNANKFLHVYKVSGQNHMAARAITISGTTFSGGTELVLSSTNVTGQLTTSFIPSINKVALFFNYSTNAHYNILTISGTSVINNVNNFNYSQAGGDYGTGQSGAAYITIAGDKEIFNFSDGTYEYFMPVEVTAAGIVFGPLASRTQWGAGASSDSVYDPDTGAVVNVDASNARIYNITAPSFVGIAAENISNGATGTVTVVGGINTSVSGLTAGKTYGLPPSSASISEIGISGDGAFGVALSSSSIYLNVGKI